MLVAGSGIAWSCELLVCVSPQGFLKLPEGVEDTRVGTPFTQTYKPEAIDSSLFFWATWFSRYRVLPSPRRRGQIVSRHKAFVRSVVAAVRAGDLQKRPIHDSSGWIHIETAAGRKLSLGIWVQNRCGLKAQSPTCGVSWLLIPRGRGSELPYSLSGSGRGLGYRIHHAAWAVLFICVFLKTHEPQYGLMKEYA